MRGRDLRCPIFQVYVLWNRVTVNSASYRWVWTISVLKSVPWASLPAQLGCSEAADAFLLPWITTERNFFPGGFLSCPDLGKKVVTVCVFQWIPEVPRRWLNWALSQHLTTILASFFKLAEGLLNNKLLLPAFKIYNSPGSWLARL